MRTFRKIVILAVSLAAISAKSDAQGLGIELDGGLQGMQYKLPGGHSTALPGGSLGLTYTFRVNSQWGVRTGILGSIYRTQASLKDGTYSSGQVDDGGSAFNYNIKATGYKETQQFYAATIPLLLHFHTGGAGLEWYFDGGGKFIFPFNTSIQASARQLSLAGYYPNFHIVVSNLPQHGFGTVNGWHAGSNTGLKPAGALSAGTGISFAISRHTRIYTGVYVDYGLTDLREKSDSMPLVTYSTAGISHVKANGAMHLPNSGAATLLSFGVQVRLSFGSATSPGRRKRTQRHETDSLRQASAAVSPAKNSPPRAAEPVSRVPASLPPAKDSTVAEAGATAVSTDNISLDSLIRRDEVQSAKRSQAERSRRNVVFGIIGETAIPDMQKAKLDELVSLLQDHPDLRLSIEGHFCDSLMQMENSQTAETRMKAVVKYLENKGISRRRMDIGYLKKSDPVLSYDPAANYRNRRVAIHIIGSF